MIKYYDLDALLLAPHARCFTPVPRSSNSKSFGPPSTPPKWTALSSGKDTLCEVLVINLIYQLDLHSLIPVNKYVVFLHYKITRNHIDCFHLCQQLARYSWLLLVNVNWFTKVRSARTAFRSASVNDLRRAVIAHEGTRLHEPTSLASQDNSAEGKGAKSWWRTSCMDKIISPKGLMKEISWAHDLSPFFVEGSTSAKDPSPRRLQLFCTAESQWIPCVFASLCPEAVAARHTCVSMSSMPSARRSEAAIGTFLLHLIGLMKQAQFYLCFLEYTIRKLS